MLKSDVKYRFVIDMQSLKDETAKAASTAAQRQHGKHEVWGQGPGEESRRPGP